MNWWIAWSCLAVLFIISIILRWPSRPKFWRLICIMWHGRAYMERRERLARWIDSL